jgi:hypothetical protein
MGMFDYITCLYLLPEGLPPGERFQTKDLTNALVEYTITADGHLQEDSASEDRTDFTGTIELYWSNVVASGPGLYTRTGEDAHVLEYRLTFVAGSVVRVDELKNEYEPALASSKFPLWKMPSAEERRSFEERSREPLTGRTMWLWWGGHKTGYAVKVVAESEHQLVLQAEDDRFQILDRFSRDRILFDSQEDGLRYTNERAAEWERRRKEYDAAIQARSASIHRPDVAP